MHDKGIIKSYPEDLKQLLSVLCCKEGKVEKKCYSRGKCSADNFYFFYTLLLTFDFELAAGRPQAERVEELCSERQQRMQWEMELAFQVHLMIVLCFVIMQNCSIYRSAERIWGGITTWEWSAKTVFYCRWRRCFHKKLTGRLLWHFLWWILRIELVCWSFSVISSDICFFFPWGNRYGSVTSCHVGFCSSCSKTWLGVERLITGTGCCNYRPF